MVAFARFQPSITPVAQTMTLDKLTIAVPVYNEADYIRQTVESCIGQAGRIILYDNASTDGTGDICAALAAEHESVTHIRHDENIGAHENMRFALEACETEYFALIGAHDVLEKEYSAPLLSALEKDSTLSLAVGTIQHIDEKDNMLKTRTQHDWVNTLYPLPPLSRLETFVTKLRDCFMIYGIFRTAHLRAAWFDEPCLGFDRIVLTRIMATGKILYVPEPVFYARDFDNIRDITKQHERRSLMLARTPVAKDNFLRNKAIAETVLAEAKTMNDLTQAFRILDKLNRRLQNRRYFQRQRLKKIIGSVALAALILTLALRN